MEAMIVLIIILMSILSSHGYPPECIYTNYGGPTHFTCSNKRINLTFFPGITNNLHLDNTSINSVPPGTFDNLDELTLLNLSHNSISDLPRNTFYKTIKLETLDLSHNKIRTLDNSLFIQLTNLNTLNLQENRISILPDSLFAKQHHLDIINLSKNQLQTLKRKVLEPLEQLEYLELSGNSFTCDCDLYGVKKWVEIKNLNISRPIQCKNTQNKSLVNWSSIEFLDVCPNTSTMYDSEEQSSSIPKSFIIAAIVILVVICICFILARPIIWYRRKSRCSGNKQKLNETYDSNENNDNVIIDLDKLYAKVNKNNGNTKITTNTKKKEETERQSVGFYTSLKEDSLYCEVSPEIAYRVADQHKPTDLQLNVKNSIYESSEKYASVNKGPS